MKVRNLVNTLNFGRTFILTTVCLSWASLALAQPESTRDNTPRFMTMQATDISCTAAGFILKIESVDSTKTRVKMKELLNDGSWSREVTLNSGPILVHPLVGSFKKLDLGGTPSSGGCDYSVESLSFQQADVRAGALIQPAGRTWNLTGGALSITQSRRRRTCLSTGSIPLTCTAELNHWAALEQ